MCLEKKLQLDDAWHWKDEEKEYKHIITSSETNKVDLGRIIPIPRSTPASPCLKRDAQHATSSLENAPTAGEDAHFARDCPKPFMNVLAQINSDAGSGNATETEKNWRKWQARLKKYYKDRVKKFRNRYKSRK